MKNLICGIVIAATIPMFLNGCRRPDTDVTSSPQYNFSSFAGTVWKTKVKVGLADLKTYKGEHHITLLTPDSFDPAHPQYRPPEHMQMIAVLPVGTRLQIERLIKEDGIGGTFYRVTASLEDGKVVYLLDDLLAKNRLLWPGESDSTDWGVNPDMLEK
ncbi:MAG: hypothetical protein ACJ8FY_12070 [Gemmataceae bacterium]